MSSAEAVRGGEGLFVRPASLASALAALEEPEAMLVGGATATTLLLKNRLIEPTRLVWIGALPELSGIAEGAPGEVVIGAATTLREITRSPLVRRLAPVFAEATGKVGNPRVRAVATLGGALVHGDPRQDVPPVLLAHRASLEIVSRAGTRRLPLAEFFRGLMETALAEGEIVTRVTIPPRPGWRDAYSRFTPGSEDDYPTVGVAVSLLVGADGRITDAEIALGGVDGSAIRVPEAAAALLGTGAAPAESATAAALAAAGCEPSDDQRGSADYKRAMVEVWTARSIAACLGQ